MTGNCHVRFWSRVERSDLLGLDNKEKIRQAIISKGVDVAEGASLSEMAEKISEIKVDNKRKEKKHA
ncbi:MAG: hypothetical protein IJ730_06670 [Alphaproteobacteria bacterium]|nr:hypothetical protein [Alphaproteobacteria bacterium]